MKIRIIWPGKTKEAYAKKGIEKYLRLLGPTAKVEIFEVKEEKGRPVETALREEGMKMLKKTSSYVLLDEKGRGVSSSGFASFLKGFDSVDFVLGGPYGVSGEVKEKAADTIRLSEMTLPHEMARVFFLEQVYRALMINRGRHYHH